MHFYLMVDMDGRIVSGYIDEESARHDWTRHPDNRVFHYEFTVSGPASSELMRSAAGQVSAHG